MPPDRLVIFAALLLASTAPALADDLDAVTLQLKWRHQFQFAGYYVAKEKGFYAEAGLDVSIHEAGEGREPVGSVLRGEAEFGVGTSDLLLLRHQGTPVVVLAVIFQHSPLRRVVRDDGSVRDLADLRGRPVMVEHQSAELWAFLAKAGIGESDVRVLPHEYDVTSLVTKKVDALSVYSTDEPFRLQQEGIPYRLFSPASAGIDFYGDNLFTTEAQIRDHPGRVRAFREASLRGWAYAMANVDETIDLIRARYSTRHEADHLRFEAREMTPLLEPGIVSPGYMHEARWRHMADTYAGLGMLPEGVFDAAFSYDPDPPADLRWLAWTVGSSVVGVGLAAAILGYLLVVNRRLTRSEARVRLLAENVYDLIWTMDVDLRHTYVSPSVERLRGFRPEAALLQSLEEAMTPESASLARREFANLLASEERSGHRWELAYTRRDGTAIWTDVTADRLLDRDGRVVGLVGITRDATERRAMQARLEELAHFDSLTGLPNRVLFRDRLDRGLAMANRSGEMLGLFFLDLDGFKVVNDRLGHAAGDELLVQVAGRLRSALRETDSVARMGGDEFTVLTQGARREGDATTTAERILAAFRDPFVVAGTGISVGASLGLSLYPVDAGDADSLMRHADVAMYAAKKAGGNRLVVHRADLLLPKVVAARDEFRK